MTLRYWRFPVALLLGVFAACFAFFSVPAAAEAPAGRYVIDAGTVTDTRTHLVWQQTTDLTAVPWTQAGPACAALDLNGKGWRLPSVKELSTLVDESRWGPAVDPVAFPNTPSDYFWTSSPVANFPMYVWTIFFGKGTAAFFDVSLPRLVRCVR